MGEKVLKAIFSIVFGIIGGLFFLGLLLVSKYLAKNYGIEAIFVLVGGMLVAMATWSGIKNQ